MSAGEHKALNRRFFEEGLNNKHLAILEEHTDVDLVAHHPTGTTQGLLAFKQVLSAYFTAFPDLHFTIEAQIAEGDLSVVHWTARGTHQGILAGIPPTGKQATARGVTIDRWAKGKVVESWGIFDNLLLMQQLRVIPQQG